MKMLSDLIGNDLKSGFDKILALKNTPNYTPEELEEVYKTDLLPYLVQLRLQNRKEKNALQEKSFKIKELYEQLTDLQEACESLSFMISCLKSQAGQPTDKRHTEHTFSNNTTNDSFDLTSVIKLDHETRMQTLEEEEFKRKELQDRLTEINSETKIYELACSQATNHLNEVRPHIKIMLERVAPTIQQVAQINL